MGAATEVRSWQLQHLVVTQKRPVKGGPRGQVSGGETLLGNPRPSPSFDSPRGHGLRGRRRFTQAALLALEGGQEAVQKPPRFPGCWESESVTVLISHDNILGRKEINFKNLTCMSYIYFKTVFRGKPHYFLHIDIMYSIFWSRMKLWLFDTHTIDQFPKDVER